MGGSVLRQFWSSRRLPPAAVALLGAALSGCSGSPLSTPAPSLSAFFNNASAAATGTAPTAPAASEDVSCPDVSIRAGASTLSVSADNRATEEGAMNLRYQVGIGETARECRLVAGNLTMKVGVQGRVILGPAGGPGQIDVPIRLAVVHEGPNPRTIMTKLNRVAVSVPDNLGNVQFTMVEDEVSFPMPRGNAIDAYVVYVGFDPLGMRSPPRRPERPARRPPA
jgi:hypothetical protein